MELLKQFSEKYMKDEVPSVSVGDTVRVHIRVKEGSRERIQVFPSTPPPSTRSRSFATASSAARSSTTCVTASARPPRSKRTCKLCHKKGAGNRSFFIQLSPMGRKRPV